MTLRKTLLAAGMIAFSGLPVLASDIILDNVSGGPTNNGTPGGFTYIGKGSSDDHMGGSKYDVYSMEVDRSDAGILTVKINTKFVDYNNQNYVFGDLFMSTTGWDPTGNAADGYQDDNAFTTGTKWDYAYDLNGARHMTGNNTDNSSARLVELNDYNLNNANDADNFKYGSSRGNDEHFYRLRSSSAVASTIGGGSVQTSTTNNYLKFVFDVSGTDLATAEQIAFHWTMSCANDIIEGTVDFASKVPEPAALGLLLIGLTGVGFARRRKQVA